MNETTLNGRTPDIAEENIAKLREIFPDVFSENKVDFDKLRQVLGEYIEDADERYNFTWNGKSKALHLAQTPSTGTLRPCKEESKDWDTTQNLYIEGDNLEVLKLLQKSYHGKIKMIYIDPPYNTGHDFVYKDDYRDNIQNYLEVTGQVDGEGRKLSTNSESSGRYHTDWLNMMYPRLRLARNLLSDDGVIFISIDDNEQGNLEKLCSEVFGEQNKLATLIWNKQHSQQQGIFKRYHESVFVYAKKVLNIKNINCGEGVIEAGALKKISSANPESEFEFPAGVRFDAPDGTEFTGTFGDAEKVTVVKGHMKAIGGKLVEPVTLSAGWTQKNQMRDFFDGLEVYDSKGQKVTEFFFNSTGKIKCLKDRSCITPPTLLPQYGTVSKQSKELEKILGGIYFDTPKPVRMIYDFANWFLKRDDIVLDFFSGSATTAHAVMQLNAEDGGNRRFICVQLPEATDEKSEAYKAGYKNICEIGKERIRRAGEKIIKNEELRMNNEKGTQLEIGDGADGSDNSSLSIIHSTLDTGFKVFKLDSSNIKKWNPDYDNLEISLLDSVENLVDGRSESDLAYEIMLKYGLDLTYPMDELDRGGKKIYSVGFGMLMICMADDVTTDVAKFIADYKKENEIDEMRVVFKDTCFKDDSAKTNIKEILKCAGVEEFVTV